MSSDLTVRVDEIRAALALVLDAVERVHGSELALAHDYYWSLPIAASFDMAVPEPALTTGQLSDDIASIRELANSREVAAPWHELAHLVGVLRAVEALDQP
jgi:hypothetical protein